MTEISFTWFRVAGSINEIGLSSNGFAELKVNGKTICIANHQGILYACAQKCPHAGGQLSQGNIDPAGNIVCPFHRYKFSLQNGRNTSGEGYYLVTYPVQNREDGIYIGFRKGGLSALF